MKVLVLGGCGMMGTEATRDLVTTSTDFEQIVVADLDVARAGQLVAQLDDKRLSAIQIDMNDQAALATLMEGFDVVANCTTYHFGLTATMAAIQAGKSYLDLGGLYNTPKQLALDANAKAAGVTICLGCGATPGITNLMAAYGAARMDSPREVHIAFASYRHLAPSAGLLDTILDEFSPSTVRFYYQDGGFHEVGPLTGAREFPFADPVGKQTVYYVPHSETHTIPRFLPGVRLVDVRGTWRPETMQALRFFVDHHLLDVTPLEVGGAQIAAKQFLKAHLLSQPKPEDPGLWAFFLTVEVVGEHQGRKVRRTTMASHPGMDQWGMTATARMTGIPASIGAQLLARKKTRLKGVGAPEACFEPELFFKELKKRGIVIHETVHEEGPLA